MPVTDVLQTPAFDSMKQQYLGSLIRAALIGFGVITAKDADHGQIEQIAGALTAIASVAWSLYQKRQNRQQALTGYQLARVTENQIKAMVANPAVATPDVATHPDVVPGPATH